MVKRYFFIDFDSTFVKTEGLEELAQIVLQNHEHKDQLILQIKAITDAGMKGELGFAESLHQRMELLRPTRQQAIQVGKLLSQKVSDSFVEHSDFFKENAGNIYIISGAFKEFILPTAEKFFIPETNIFANTLLFDAEGNYAGYDLQNPLAKNRGKVKVMADLILWGEKFVIGDGFTDYEIKLHNPEVTFIAFTENVYRDIVVSKADFEAKNLGQFLKHLEQITVPS